MRADARFERSGDRCRILDDGFPGTVHWVPEELAGDVERAAGGAVAPGEALDWLSDRYLLDGPAAREVIEWEQQATPRREAGRALPLLVPAAARFTCHGCGACCQTVIPMPVHAHERARILSHAEFLRRTFPGEDPESLFLRERSIAGLEIYSLRTRDGRCVFLGDDNLCRIHKEVGGDVKPAVCREFPLAFAVTPDGVQVSLRPNCESAARSRRDGQPLGEQQAWILDMLAEGRAGARVASLVEVGAGRLWPFGLLRLVETRLLSIAASATDTRALALSLRDLLEGVLRVVPARLTGDALARAALLTRDSMTALRAARGAVDARRGLAALRFLLAHLGDAAVHDVEERRTHTPREGKNIASDALYVDAVWTLNADYARMTGWPAPSLTDEQAQEAAAAVAVDAGDAAPAVVDYVRDVWTQALQGKRWLHDDGGIASGMGRQVLEQLIARQAARLVAARDGRTRATPDDWNMGFAAAERTHLRMTFEGPFAAAMRDLFAHLAFPEETR